MDVTTEADRQGRGGEMADTFAASQLRAHADEELEQQLHITANLPEETLAALAGGRSLLLPLLLQVWPAVGLACCCRLRLLLIWPAAGCPLCGTTFGGGSDSRRMWPSLAASCLPVSWHCRQAERRQGLTNREGCCVPPHSPAPHLQSSATAPRPLGGSCALCSSTAALATSNWGSSMVRGVLLCCAGCRGETCWVPWEGLAWRCG